MARSACPRLGHRGAGQEPDARRPCSSARSSCSSTRPRRRARRCSPPAARPCSAAGSRKTRCSTPTTSSCGGGAACCASASRTARAASPSRGRCSPSAMKVREEHETLVGDGEVLLRVLRGARAARLVPLREVPRGVLARGRDRRDRRDAGRRVRRDRRQRARASPPWPRRSAARRPTTSSTRTAACSCSARGRPRHGLRPGRGHARSSSRRARPDSRGRTRHAAAPADPRARQGRGAGQRRAAGPPHRRAGSCAHGFADLVVNLHHRPGDRSPRLRRRRRAISARACATRGSSRCSDRPAGRATRCRCSSTATTIRARAFLLVNGDTLTDVGPRRAARRARARRRAASRWR